MFRRLALVDFGSEVSSLRRMLFAGLFGLIVIGVTSYAGGLVYGVVVVTSLLGPEIQFLMMRMIPPLVLFLSASEGEDPLRSAALVSVLLPGKRLVTILRPHSRASSRSYDRLLSYRTHDDTWMTMLDELLELAPIVAVDYRTVTDAIQTEMQQILDQRLGFKTVVLARSDQAERSRPISGLVSSGQGVCVTTFDALTYVVRMFAHPLMLLPTPEQPIQAMVDDARRLNAEVDFAVWGHPLPPIEPGESGPRPGGVVR